MIDGPWKSPICLAYSIVRETLWFLFELNFIWMIYSLLNLDQHFYLVKESWIESFSSERVTHFIGMLKLFVWYSNAALVATIDSLNFPARNRKGNVFKQFFFVVVVMGKTRIQRWWDARSSPCENFDPSEKNIRNVVFSRHTFNGEDKGEWSHFISTDR